MRGLCILSSFPNSFDDIAEWFEVPNQKHEQKVEKSRAYTVDQPQAGAVAPLVSSGS